MTLVATHARVRSAALLLALSLIGAACAAVIVRTRGGGSKGTDSTALGAGVQRLDLALTSGRVEVLPASGQASMVSDGAKGVQTSVHGVGVSIHCRGGDACSVTRMVLRLPPNTDIRMRVGSGAVTLTRMTGSANIISTGAALNIFDGRSSAASLSSRSGAVHVSLAAVPTSLSVHTGSGSIYVTVPYDYEHDGYHYTARSSGLKTLDMTSSREKGAPRVTVISDSGALAIAQRYPNMS